jgi:hypothetical protein
MPSNLFRSIAIFSLWVLMVFLKTPVALSLAALPKTVAEIALYQGPDREKVLLEGARKEGQLTFYSSNASMANAIPAGF